MNVCEAEIVLKTHRMAYDAGFRLTDPDSVSGGRDIIPHVTVKDRQKTLDAFTKGRRS